MRVVNRQLCNSLDWQESDLVSFVDGVFPEKDGVFFVHKVEAFFFGEQDFALAFYDISEGVSALAVFDNAEGDLRVHDSGPLFKFGRNTSLPHSRSIFLNKHSYSVISVFSFVFTVKPKRKLGILWPFFKSSWMSSSVLGIQCSNGFPFFMICCLSFLDNECERIGI